MAQRTFEVDATTLKSIGELKEKFGVTSDAQVIRRALALARIATENAIGDKLTIEGPNGKKDIQPSAQHSTAVRIQAYLSPTPSR
jgi:hypothetical protein